MWERYTTYQIDSYPILNNCSPNVQSSQNITVQLSTVQMGTVQMWIAWYYLHLWWYFCGAYSTFNIFIFPHSFSTFIKLKRCSFPIHSIFCASLGKHKDYCVLHQQHLHHKKSLCQYLAFFRCLEPGDFGPILFQNTCKLLQIRCW